MALLADELLHAPQEKVDPQIPKSLNPKVASNPQTLRLRAYRTLR